MKLLIVLLALVVLLWLVFGRRRRRDRTDRPPRAAPPATRDAEGMLACAHCGVHLPASEALQAGRLAYCSAAHRDAGPRDNGS